MKLCKACGQTKPLDQFHNDRSKPDGKNFYCKPCMIAKQHEYAARPPRRKDPEGMRTCSRCKTLKPLTDYHVSRRRIDGIDRRCKACNAEMHDEWRRAHLGYAAQHAREWRAKYPDRARDHDVKRNYGLAHGSYDRMLAAQDGRCAICRTDQPGGKGRFHVDHCHDTNRVRGLLCHNCNVGIGHFKNDVNLLNSAQVYLLSG